MISKRNFILIVKQVIEEHSERGESIPLADAQKKALERAFPGDPQGAIDFLFQTTVNAIAGAVYHIALEPPTTRATQQALFGISETIVNKTPDGPLYIAKKKATVRQVHAWMRLGHQHHGIRATWFKAGLDRLDSAVETKSIDMDAIYEDVRKELGAGDQQDAIESADADDDAEDEAL